MDQEKTEECVKLLAELGAKLEALFNGMGEQTETANNLISELTELARGGPWEI